MTDLLAKARERAALLLGGVAPSVREKIAEEFVAWWLEGQATPL